MVPLSFTSKNTSFKLLISIRKSTVAFSILMMYLMTLFYEGLSWQCENYQFIKQHYHYWFRVNSEECTLQKMP